MVCADLLSVICCEHQEQEDPDRAYDRLKLLQVDKDGQDPECDQEDKSCRHKRTDPAEIRVGGITKDRHDPEEQRRSAKDQDQVCGCVNQKQSGEHDAV